MDFGKEKKSRQQSGVGRGVANCRKIVAAVVLN